MHALNGTQKKLKQQGYAVKPSRIDEPRKAPQAFEDGGQSIVDELKELNLGTNGDLRSYKEMLGFDLKVVVHQLMVKHGV
ncbi:hypothetical protein CK203_100976 [Vitis vinifera]|uniref:Uncharacterized protein n=1 Tax=Vitis vinifera TaxID=29760 RepID=A0A438DFY1_VITVI|nr:hypothetical protein CK203_100976 [Vitis vinifera]